MFRNREDAAIQLSEKFMGRRLVDPLVLAIPRGGIVTGDVLAEELGAELDVVLSRKLRAPGQPELAVGAVCEDGTMYVNASATEMLGLSAGDLEQERQRQLKEIARRQALFRSVRPRAVVADRSVIVTDDGVATGSTMIAALQSLKSHSPRELIAAFPVAPPERLAEIRQWCDDVVCLLSPDAFWAVGQFYQDFEQIEDDEVVDRLRRAAARLGRVRRDSAIGAAHSGDQGSRISSL